jgi:hypothetical protein
LGTFLFKSSGVVREPAGNHHGSQKILAEFDSKLVYGSIMVGRTIKVPEWWLEGGFTA